jgi:uncharacterized membrane protein YidH (DUF202 family)
MIAGMKAKTPGWSNVLLRIVVIGAGVLSSLIGIARTMRGIVGVRNWQGQPAWSVGLIMVGLVVAFLAILPQSWVEKLASSQKSRSKPLRLEKFRGKRQKGR